MYKLLANPIEHNGQRVLTTAQLAEAYGTDSKIISNNFNRHPERYIEGKHYYRLTGKAKREFCNRHQIDDGSKATVFYLWLEKGTLLHAKSLNTDKAWEVYDFLVDTYFRARQMETYYNDMLVKIIEKLEKIEKRQDRQEERQQQLEQYIQNEFINIRKDMKDIFDDSLGKNNNVMIPAFTSIYDEIASKHNEVVRIVRNLILYRLDRKKALPSKNTKKYKGE